MRWREAALALFIALPACGRRDRTASGIDRGAGRRDSLLSVGESLYVHEKFDSAKDAWTVALDAARAGRDEPREARALTWLALARHHTGDVKEARRNATDALAIKTRLRMTGELSKSYNALGLVALDEDRNEEAAELFNHAIETARAVNDTSGLVKASGNLALPAMALGEYQAARDGSRLLRSASRALNDPLHEGNGLLNEAATDIWEGDPRPAIARLDTARALYRRAASDEDNAKALSQLATAFELTGDLDRAFAALDTAVAITHRLGLRSDEAENLRLLAGLHVDIGDYRRAVEYFDDAEARMRSEGFESERASALRGGADAHLRLGNTRRASASAEEALRLHTAADERVEQLDDLLLLAEIDYETGGLARAEPRLRAALALADRLDTRATRIAVAMAEARLADRARNPRRVLRALRGAGPDIAAGDFGVDWEANALAARSYSRLNELDSAAAVGRRAVAAVERLRGALGSETVRATYVADRADVYSDLVLVLLRLGRTDEAFGVADAARSRELLTQLAAARADRSALPAELLEREGLLRRIDALVQRLRERERGRRSERGEPPDSVNAALSARLAVARGEYEALVIRLAQQRPRSVALLGADSTRIDEIRAALEPGEVLLDYLLTADRVLVFALTRSGLQVVQADLDAKALTQRVRLLRDLWGSPAPNWQWGLGAARALHRTLLAPLRDAGVLNAARRLLIVPHGILGQVPFAALVDERTGRYVVEDFAITILPSAGALPALRRRSDAASGPTTSVAEGLAPFPDELPATRGEVEAFAAALPQATIRIGPRATEAELRRALTGNGLVHVATHGVLNVRTPMFSRIELARPRSPSDDNDGRLEIHELLNLEIHSPLVFLSGCETGAGQEWTDDPVRGAAELTLAQAMLTAGAANVILTLWRIDDAGAATFAGRFYRALPRLPVDEALAEAQRATSRDPRYASPYYWAGYMLSGAGRLGGGSQIAAGPSVSTMRGSSPPSSAVRRSTP